MEPMVIVHGGVAAPAEWRDGCVTAAAAGLATLSAGGDALRAAVDATVALENDGRFNAGRGSVLRLDGETMEMDAGLMDSDRRIGAVAALRGYENPILVALEVMDTPHVLLAGEGAGRFAALRGMEERTAGPTPECLARHERAMRKLGEGSLKRPVWREADFTRLWNFEEPLPEELRPRDTVGAVVRDSDGRFAAANSTGGAVPMLLGRVGDSPIPGAGFWCGPHGAVATTGVGEAIIKRMSAVDIYERMVRGAKPQEAIEEVVADYPAHDFFGAIAVDAESHGIASNREMPEAVATP